MHESPNESAPAVLWLLSVSAAILRVALALADDGERVAREEALEGAAVVLAASANLLLARVQVPLTRKPALWNVRLPKPPAIRQRILLRYLWPLS